MNPVRWFGPELLTPRWKTQSQRQIDWKSPELSRSENENVLKQANVLDAHELCLEVVLRIVARGPAAPRYTGAPTFDDACREGG